MENTSELRRTLKPRISTVVVTSFTKHGTTYLNITCPLFTPSVDYDWLVDETSRFLKNSGFGYTKNDDIEKGSKLITFTLCSLKSIVVTKPLQENSCDESCKIFFYITLFVLVIVGISIVLNAAEKKKPTPEPPSMSQEEAKSRLNDVRETLDRLKQQEQKLPTIQPIAEENKQAIA